MVYCTVCDSGLISLETKGSKVNYKCNACQFVGKPSKYRWLAELYFMLQIGYNNIAKRFK